MKEAIFWLMPYLFCAILFTALRMYCRYVYRHTRMRLEDMEEKIASKQDTEETLQIRAETKSLLSSFPECLLKYSLFTYPDPPLSPSHPIE